MDEDHFCYCGHVVSHIEQVLPGHFDVLTTVGPETAQIVAAVGTLQAAREAAIAAVSHYGADGHHQLMPTPSAD
jgi:hypothetical protein